MWTKPPSISASPCWTSFPCSTSHPDLQKLIKDELESVEKDPAWRTKMAASAGMPHPELAPLNRQVAFAHRAIFNEVHRP